MKTKQPLPKFENRVRFNWGFHDAALAVRQGWANPERNFGFGPALKVAKPEDVQEQHYDKVWAAGWKFGYDQAKAGLETPTSQPAWEKAVSEGLVSA